LLVVSPGEVLSLIGRNIGVTAEILTSVSKWNSESWENY
jgi:hypothetical protein